MLTHLSVISMIRSTHMTDDANDTNSTYHLASSNNGWGNWGNGSWGNNTPAGVEGHWGMTTNTTLGPLWSWVRAFVAKMGI